MPHRGKTCEPAFVADTAAFVAELRGETLEALARSDHRAISSACSSKAARVKLRMLGCGTSTGVPRIGNDWGECDPDEPRNRRTRVSILVESDGASGCWSMRRPTCAQQLLAAEHRHGRRGVL